ncbi:hypothetical protein ACRB8A_00710 [Arthrobacter sp. G.S.26]|uniref:hypothetical protein n=1 Tax=Micrococcaceae TaxID=1268 RepID=UPI002557BBF8|nr:hypothetical protein [Pseudarthrobacter sp. MEB009]
MHGSRWLSRTGFPAVADPNFEAVGALEHHPRLQDVTGDPENRIVQGDCVDDTFALVMPLHLI